MSFVGVPLLTHALYNSVKSCATVFPIVSLTILVHTPLCLPVAFILSFFSYLLYPVSSPLTIISCLILPDKLAYDTL